MLLWVFMLAGWTCAVSLFSRRLPLAMVARVLGVAGGAPVMQLRRTALSFGDRPVEWRTSIVNTALHEYVHRLSRPAQRHG